MKSIIKLSLAAMAFWAFSPEPARAQIDSTYTNRMLSGIQNRNSATAFTAQRMQNSVLNRVVPTYNFSNANRNVLNAARGKPFSSFQPSSPVSPYMALDQPFQNTATTYYTQIRPMQEQQRQNQRAAQQSAAMQRQLNAMAAQGPYSPVGDAQRAPTGHAATFMNYGGYYQMPAPRY